MKVTCHVWLCWILNLGLVCDGEALNPWAASTLEVTILIVTRSREIGHKTGPYMPQGPGY